MTKPIETGLLPATTRRGLLLGAAAVGASSLAMPHIARAADPIRIGLLQAKQGPIVQQAEYDAMFKTDKAAIRSPETYSDLKDAKRIVLNNEPVPDSSVRDVADGPIPAASVVCATLA